MNALVTETFLLNVHEFIQVQGHHAECGQRSIGAEVVSLLQVPHQADAARDLLCGWLTLYHSPERQLHLSLRVVSGALLDICGKLTRLLVDEVAVEEAERLGRLRGRKPDRT